MHDKTCSLSISQPSFDQNSSNDFGDFMEDKVGTECTCGASQKNAEKNE